MANTFVFIAGIYKVFRVNANGFFGRFTTELARFSKIEGNRDRARSMALYAVGVIAKVTENRELAGSLQEQLCLGLAEEDGVMIKEVLDGCVAVCKLLSAEDLNQLFLNLVEYLRDAVDEEYVTKAISTVRKFLRHCGPENKEFFLQKSYDLINEFFEGKLKCQVGVKPFSQNTDHFLLSSIGGLIARVVATPSPNVDDLCKMMLHVMAIPESSVLYVFIGAYGDAVKFGTCSQPMIDALLAWLPTTYATVDPDVRQNVSWVLNVIVQYHEAMINHVVAAIPVMWGWFQDGIREAAGFRLSLDNIASLFLSLAIKGATFSDEMLMGALRQIPPDDKKETFVMAENLICLLRMSRLAGPVLQAAAVSLSELLFLNEGERTDRDMTPELVDSIICMLRDIVGQTSGMNEFLRGRFSKSRTKLKKLQDVLG
jgi:hypothetical protein